MTFRHIGKFSFRKIREINSVLCIICVWFWPPKPRHFIVGKTSRFWLERVKKLITITGPLYRNKMVVLIHRTKCNVNYERSTSVRVRIEQSDFEEIIIICNFLSCILCLVLSRHSSSPGFNNSNQTSLQSQNLLSYRE